MTRRIFPHPLLTLLLWAMWLLLQQSASPGQLLLGLIVAFVASQAMAALQIPRPRLRRFPKVLRLFGLVVMDVLRSNLAVSRIILLGGARAETSGFVLVPLELTDRNGLAILSCIVTATPGSAWLEYDPLASTVLIHVFDLIDEQQWIDTVKDRYERRLLEIFQ